MASSKKPRPPIKTGRAAREDSFRSAAVQAASWLRAAMRAQGVSEGATTYQFILNQLPAKMGRSAPRQIPNIGGEPFRPSVAARKMDAIAASLAARLERLCADSLIPLSQADHVVDELSMELMSEISGNSATLPATPAVPSPSPIPTRPAIQNPARAQSPARSGPGVRKFKPIPQMPSAEQNKASPLSRKPPTPAAKSESSGRAGKAKPRLSVPIRSLVPARSSKAQEQMQYDERLQRLVADLRQLLARGPKLFGPLPAHKREYVEQLLALIEDHEQRYRARQVPAPFRFSPDEKQELEDFCPAFKLRGLEWLQTEGPGATG
ncbi:MAG: hypothetical protein V1728_04335 [Candidatus Micrarchaeota archaeon]